MTLISRRTFTTTALISMAGALSACSSPQREAAPIPDGPWGNTIKAAASEGTLALYSGLSEVQNARLLAAFATTYPDIKVQATRGGVEIIARVEGEMSGRTDGADVFIHADPQWYIAQADAFLPATGPAAEVWDAGGWAVEGTSPIATQTPNAVFLWNTDIFPEGFKTWDDLLDPSVKGKLGMRTDAATKSAAGFFTMIEDELGEDYLVKLSQQRPKSYPSSVPLAQAVASGEIGVTNVSLPASIIELKDKGAPIDYVFPRPGYGIEFACAALKKSKRPNAAAVLMDFILTPEGQGALNGDGFGGTAGSNEVPGALDLDGMVIMDSPSLTPTVIQNLDNKLAALFAN